MSWTKEEMADKVIEMFHENSSVNLGIGIPTLIAERIPSDKNIMIHSENGVLGVSGRPKKSSVSATLINAGKETIAIAKGASFFDSSLSFGMIRGGHIDYCVLGGMQVDCEGNLANWMIPGAKVTGMGGAMDLVHGSKEVIIMMTHITKKNTPKLLKLCTLPFTGKHVVHTVVTDKGIFKPENDKFTIIELAKDITENKLSMDGILH
jgi:3-oxoacid CoA-transferase subunit B